MADQPSPGPKRYRLRALPVSIWMLGFVSMFMDISSEMIHALLPVYLVTVLGTSTLVVGVIEGIAEATASITKIFSGALSDYLGRRKMVAALGYGLAAISKPAFPLAGSVGWLMAARFVDRVGKGVREAPRDALIADLSPPRLRGASYGLRQSLDTIGAFVGPLLAILLMWATADDFKAVFWIAVLPAFMSFGLILFAVRDPPALRESRVRSPLSRKELAKLSGSYWLVVLVACLFTLARFSEAFLILRAQSVGLAIALVPGVLVVMNLVYAPVAAPIGLLSDRIGRVWLLVTGFLVLILADLILGFATNIPTVAIGVALWGLHMGLTQGLLAALVADTAPARLRGTAFGMFNLTTGLALLVASIVAGALWDRFGPQATFLAGAAFTLLALIGLLPIRRHLPKGASR
jgi:MFS family permease